MTTQPDEAVLPYAGTSGSAGHGPSARRTSRKDHSGETARKQRKALSSIDASDMPGLTALEMRVEWGETNPNLVSPILSGLHKAGLICKLEEERDGHGVYVMPRFVGNRRTVAHGRGLDKEQKLRLEMLHAFMDLLGEKPDGTWDEAIEAAMAVARGPVREPRNAPTLFAVKDRPTARPAAEDAEES